MIIIKDNFLTEIIGKNVYNISFGIPSTVSISEIENCLYCIKIDSFKLNEVNLLLDIGFRLVGTEITFSNIGTFPMFALPKYHIKDSIKESHIKKYIVDKIALGSFKEDRFHTDTKIPNDIADEVKAKWAENALNGKRGDSIGVAFDNIENPVGFLIGIEKEETAIIDLIAVKSNMQGKGIGSDLIRWFGKKYAECHMEAKTQLHNESSLGLYKKFGIDNIISSKYVLHMHT